MHFTPSACACKSEKKGQTIYIVFVCTRSHDDIKIIKIIKKKFFLMRAIKKVKVWMKYKRHPNEQFFDFFLLLLR